MEDIGVGLCVCVRVSFDYVIYSMKWLWRMVLVLTPQSMFTLFPILLEVCFKATA